MPPDSNKALQEYLFTFLTPERAAKMRRIVKDRTRHVTVVLEDIYQPHNASAVLRSCDCFGIQDVHIIENRNEYNVNPDVALGSSRWVDMYKYNAEGLGNTKACLENLRKKGYRLIATTPHDPDISLENLAVTEKTALVFGTELKGLTEEAINLCDQRMIIPMRGFTESYNISVSAALCLFQLRTKLEQSGVKWQLSEAEETEILLSWARTSIRASEKLEEQFKAGITEEKNG